MTEVHFEKIEEIIISNLQAANSTIKIAVAWITSVKIIDVLEKCLDEGIIVSIIFFNDKINNVENFKKLHNKGAIIKYSTNLMHNKFCLIDNKIIINGSYNWTNSAKTNDENIQITTSVELAKEFEKEFVRILNKSTSVKKYFSEDEEMFRKYLQIIGVPSKFPVFCKVDLKKYSDYNIFIKNFNHLKQYNYIYKLFYNKKEYEEFIYETYIVVETLNKNKKIVFFASTINLGNSKNYVDHFGVVGSFIPLDIITINDINLVSEISPKKYLNKEIRFSSKEFIYFDDIKTDNILMIGWNNNTIIADDEKILMMLMKNTNDINQIGKYYFDTIKIEENFIIRSKNTYNLKINSTGERMILDYKTFINNATFLIDEVLSADYNNNQEKIKKEILYNNQIKKINNIKKVEEYKKKNECYIATMIYHDNQNYNVIKLREFRNEVLLKNYLGIKTVILYYRISPWLVGKLKNQYIIHKMIKFCIEKIILKHF